MFDNLVSSAVFPAVLELLRAADKSLEGVKERLTEQSKGTDPVVMMAADAQLAALAAWEPALRDIMAAIDQSHQTVHGRPLPESHK